MDIEALWERAKKQTEIVRLRMKDLATFEATRVPYIFLGESSLNQGDTVVRQGAVMIERPSIVLPGLSPQFEGFQFEKDWQLSEQSVATFLLVRGVRFPSLRYQHEMSSLDIAERSLSESVKHHVDQLAKREDTQTGLVIGPEDAWQFSVLLLVGALVIRSAEGDIRRILDAGRKRESS